MYVRPEDETTWLNFQHYAAGKQVSMSQVLAELMRRFLGGELGAPPPGEGRHRPRDEPEADELDQLFCEDDRTLCVLPDRPCECCYLATTELEAARDE